MFLKIQAALLPQKHISYSQSLVGLAGRARSILRKGPRTIDQLINELVDSADGLISPPTTEHLVLAVTLLYAIRHANMDEYGHLVISE